MGLKDYAVLSAALLLLATVGFTGSSAVAAENNKQIATVNIQDVLLGSEAGKEVKGSKFKVYNHWHCLLW